MADTSLTLLIRAKVADALEKIKSTSSAIRQLGERTKRAGEGTRNLNNNFRRARRELQSFKLQVSDLEVTLQNLFSVLVIYRGQQFLRDSIRSANEFKMAMIGLASIAKFKGIEVASAFQAASQLSADGLIDVGSAAKALQNLLVRGYGIEEAITMLNRLKDAAAVNRQGHLSMAEAIVSATEGLKNENSILVDNAGVTKNVSVMWKEYAEKIGKTVGQLTLAEKRQAEYLGILQETEPMVGNAAKLAGEFQGQQAKLNQEIKIFKARLGEELLPALQKITSAANWLLKNVLTPMLWRIKASGVIWGNWITSIETIASWVKSGFKGGIGRLKKELEELDRLGEEMLMNLAEEMEKDPFEKAAESAQKLTQNQKQLVQASNELKQAQQELNQLGKLRQGAIKEEEKNIQSLIRTIRQKYNAAIQLKKQYAAEVKKQQKAIENIAQTTQDKIHAIRQRGMSEEERVLDRQRQYQEKLAAAAEAYYGGSLEKAAKLAQEAQNIAEGLKDQEEAERGVQDAGNLLLRIHEEMKAKAEENLATQQKNTEDLNAQLEKYEEKLTNIKGQLDELSKKKTLTEIDADISKAKTKIEELKRKLKEIKNQEVIIDIKGRASPIKPISETLHDVAQKIAAISGVKNLTLRFNLPHLSPSFSFPTAGPQSMQRNFHLHIGNITKNMPMRMQNLMERLSEEFELYQARGGT